VPDAGENGVITAVEMHLFPNRHFDGNNICILPLICKEKRAAMR
jgi:hypothetical protein